jgi:APA family basic amino acid/polyamine antiporter
MLGLGSILGTGVFVSIGIAAGIAGPAVILAIVLAAGVAACNALSSAQLAAAHPVSGGTYEYGYRVLSPAMGFTAGWMFLVAKTASAASAALGLAGYLLHLLDLDWPPVPVAVAAVLVLTAIVLAGIRRSSGANIVVVSVTLAALGAFVLIGWPTAFRQAEANLRPFFAGTGGAQQVSSLFHATALMFVAYTGYGRLATLGEEVREPRKTIPRAIIITLVISASLYLAVGFVAVGAVGAESLAAATGRAAPLEAAAGALGMPWVAVVVAVGAMTAMTGVLLNLILGLSRVWLAMGRRGDMPARLAGVDRGTPGPAILLTGLLIAGLALLGDVRTTWSFSAFAVLIYYGITNLAALRMPPEARLYPPVFAGAGLVSCLVLAFWVDWRVWAIGLGLIGLGLLWHRMRRHFATPGASSGPLAGG